MKIHGLPMLKTLPKLSSVFGGLIVTVRVNSLKEPLNPTAT